MCRRTGATFVAVTNETDSTKLTSLIQELAEALERAKQIRHHAIRPTHRHESTSRVRTILEEISMTDAPRITVEELKKRMDAGEDFTVIDVRNPTAWAETDTAIPEAIRVPLDKIEENLSRIPKNRPVVAYCT